MDFTTEARKHIAVRTAMVAPLAQTSKITWGFAMNAATMALFFLVMAAPYSIVAVVSVTTGPAFESSGQDIDSEVNRDS